MLWHILSTTSWEQEETSSRQGKTLDRLGGIGYAGAG